jgi:methylated-DNA-protein-cysteine methyltransferase related protein
LGPEPESRMATPTSTYSRIYRTVRRIPRGRVATYGQIARLSGFPGHARLVGYALHHLRDETDRTVPWHRVINAQGRISLGEFDGADLQRQLLLAEGVVFDSHRRVDLDRFGWSK